MCTLPATIDKYDDKYIISSVHKKEKKGGFEVIRWNARKKKTNKISGIIVLLYLVGLTALTLFIGWGVSFWIIVLGDSPNHGAIAYVPHWIFIFSIFLVLHRSRPVREFYEKIEKRFF